MHDRPLGLMFNLCFIFLNITIMSASRIFSRGGEIRDLATNESPPAGSRDRAPVRVWTLEAFGSLGAKPTTGCINNSSTERFAKTLYTTFLREVTSASIPILPMRVGAWSQRHALSKFTEQNSTELCHMFASGPDTKMCIQNLGVATL